MAKITKNQIRKSYPPSPQTYLEPLAEEEDSLFLSMSNGAADVTSLFGNIREIFGFQQKFLAALEGAVDAEPNFHQLDTLAQFKVGA